ncbi:hypothetical protein H0H81_003958, partial [Sphagnurus paluster]
MSTNDWVPSRNSVVPVNANSNEAPNAIFRYLFKFTRKNSNDRLKETDVAIVITGGSLKERQDFVNNAQHGIPPAIEQEDTQSQATPGICEVIDPPINAIKKDGIYHVTIAHPRNKTHKVVILYDAEDHSKDLIHQLQKIGCGLRNSYSKNKFYGLIHLLDISSESASTIPERSKAKHVLEKYIETTNILLATTGKTQPKDDPALRNRLKELVGHPVPMYHLIGPQELLEDGTRTPNELFETIVSTRSEWGQREQNNDDDFLDDPRPSDIIIP